ncbi:hypothetical protein [Chryseobacterium daeguense]|uniref:hypothetical protein n=1 Tax=Chryseobacterium daeguense TaxID=412438 RepID=UPI0004198762|nr:hypothetical protein [Chryseobacterium daeguense]
MNTSELIINTNDKEMLDAINMTSDSWHEMPIPDHPVYPQFSRKLIVSGFSNPDMELPEERIYVYVTQVLTLKTTNNVHKKIRMPDWVIYEWNKEEVMRPDGTFITGIRQIKDEEGNIISENEEVIKMPSIQYVRFLNKTKSVYLVDILARFMIQYVDKFQTEIDDI